MQALTSRRHSLRTSLVMVLALLAPLTSCTPNPIITGEPCTTTQTTERLAQGSLDKMDILLAIDNSRSMADKQSILALAITDLVKSVMNPKCLDNNGAAVANQPANPFDACPAGSDREFAPIVDIHIGVISSSIGGHGADSCPDVDSMSKECAPAANTTNNDRGHLLARTEQCGTTQAPTYQGKKFLAWDPLQLNNPPGENTLDNGNGGGIVPTLRDMVLGVGQIGCGYESQLESIYRFLVDPEPYEKIVVEDFKATPMGVDLELLEQRKAFLRPDSILSIVMLTDENDCSIKEFGQFYYVGQLRNGATPVRLPRARQECAADPNDPCCKSCGQSAGACPNDPTCMDPNGGSGPALLSDLEDNINLRCWDQKRRFGIDFLYPTDRYVQAFSNATIADRQGNLVANPIFSDLDPQDDNSNIRDDGMVFVSGIVGVPWQDIARDKTDLKKGFKNAVELAGVSDPINPNSPSTWDMILGDPAKNIKPLDPHMIETYKKRSGTNPITGDALVDSSTPLGNVINGHEWTIPNDDLQYACIFPLLPGNERDCTDTNLPACDCTLSTNDNPLCAANPNDANMPTLQVRAKAYPSIRPLQVLRDLGSQGVVSSVCAAQVTDSSEMASDFGYRAAMGALRDRFKPALGGQCLPRTLPVDSSGQAPCLIIEARHSNNTCACDPATGRKTITAGSNAEKAVTIAKQDPRSEAEQWNCFCEIPQSTGVDLAACQNDVSDHPMVDGKNVDGWCYVDAGTSPPVGNPELVSKCPDNEKRNIRFLGQAAVSPGATLFISCQNGSSQCL